MNGAPMRNGDKEAPERVDRLLEACIYVDDLEAAERFYSTVLGLELYSANNGRDVFFRCGDAMFLVFNPKRTRIRDSDVPVHGATGAGHVAFAVRDSQLQRWRRRLQAHGVTIEEEIEWPGGGRSLYFRDPSGNSVELATPSLWGFPR